MTHTPDLTIALAKQGKVATGEETIRKKYSKINKITGANFFRSYHLLSERCCC